MRRTLEGNVPALDGIRGLAILAVLAHQLLLDLPLRSRALRLAEAAVQSGWIGVQLFFVLSGFLITGILLDTRGAEHAWSSFFMRRVLRIFPLYYLLLAALLLVVPRLTSPSWMLPGGGSHLGYWFYVSNWGPLFHSAGVPALGHCWSLAVEEQFYLAWPLVVYALRPRTLARLCAVLAAGALVLRIVLLRAGAPHELLYGWTLTRMDALALGALTAIAVRDAAWFTRLSPHLHRLAVAAAAALAATALGTGMLARLNPVTLTLGDTAVAVASAALVLVAVQQSARRIGRVAALLSWAPLRRFGKHSYAIYVLHLPLHLVFTQRVLLPRLAGASDLALVGWQLAYYAGGTAALLGLALLCHAAIERPCMSLKRHFTPGPARAAAR